MVLNVMFSPTMNYELAIEVPPVKTYGVIVGVAVNVGVSDSVGELTTVGVREGKIVVGDGEAGTVAVGEAITVSVGMTNGVGEGVANAVGTRGAVGVAAGVTSK